MMDLHAYDIQVELKSQGVMTDSSRSVVETHIAYSRGEAGELCVSQLRAEQQQGKIAPNVVISIMGIHRKQRISGISQDYLQRYLADHALRYVEMMKMQDADEKTRKHSKSVWGWASNK